MFSKTFSKNLDVQHLIFLFFSYQQLLLLQRKTQEHAVHHTSGITKLIMANFNVLILLFSANKKRLKTSKSLLQQKYLECWKYLECCVG